MGTKRDNNRDLVQQSTAAASGIVSPEDASAGVKAPGIDADRIGAAGLEAAGIDELDVAILRHLERHGRATNFEVGEAVGLSASAASRRILALEASGAIRSYRALIDDRLLGKHMTVYIRVTLERQSAAVLSAFETAVRHCHDIVSCHLLAGQYDYILVARVAGIDDYNRLHQNELSRLPGVIRLETSFALRDVLEMKSS
ncbi:MAG: Lrp/AsnC family transcriptional regulator [Terracidiphilus sp.]|jgi:DNA-binding Lrp family transcriptional regulator